MSDASEAQSRHDGMMNVLAALGARASTATTAYTSEDLYAHRGLAATIVDRPAEDALARGIEIENDADQRIAAEFDRLDVVLQFTDGLRAALLTGAAAVLPLTDDAAALTAPINLDRLRRIRGLAIYPAGQISREGAARIIDPRDPHYGEPQFYKLSPENGGEPFAVHQSRLLRIPGEPLPRGLVAKAATLPWMGRPVLDACVDELQDYAEARRWLLRALERKQAPVLHMQGLAELLSLPGMDGEQMVQRRLMMLDVMRSLLNTVAVDKDDEFTVTDLSVAGMDSALNEFRIALAGAARMPVSILFGEAPKGLGSTGQGELQVYHGRIEQLRGRCLRAPLERLVEIITAQEGFPRQGEWRVLFPALWSPSAKERAETAKIEAEAEQIRVATTQAIQTAGLALPEEGRRYIAETMPERGLTPDLPADAFPEPEPEPDDDGPPAPP